MSVVQFQDQHPSLDSYWRAIVLFGQNVASYKFALAQSLLELAAQGKTRVSLAELAGPYSSHISEHLRKADKQATSPSSWFLNACRSHNRGEPNNDARSPSGRRSMLGLKLSVKLG